MARPSEPGSALLRPAGVRSIAPAAVAAVGVSALVGAFALTHVVGARAAALTFLTQALFTAPGVLIVRSALGRSHGWLVPLTFGPLIGIAVSSVALLGWWAAGARDGWLLVLAPLCAAVLIWPAGRLRGCFRPVRGRAGDFPCLALLVLVVPLVTWRAFSLVGAEVGDGTAYRAYFTADYVWRRAVVAELAKGDFLPANPFYAGDVLHYYWLPHLMTAVEYRLSGDPRALDGLLLARSLLVDGLFVSFLYGVVRLFVANPPAAAGGVACALLFTSFEGAYVLWDHWRLDAPFERIRYLNVDSITRWLLQGMPIDGLHRVLLYQPHHALGYSLGLAGFVTITLRARRRDPWVFAAAGALLGMSVLVSSFGGLMFTTAAAVHEGVATLRAWDWRRALLHAGAAFVPLALAASALGALRYVDRGGQVILLGLNPVATHRLLASTALSFGPMLLLSAGGTWVAERRHRVRLVPLASLAATCVVFYFFVDIRDHANVYVGWRVGHLLFIASAIPMAMLLAFLGRLPGRRRVWPALAVTMVLAAAAPTVLIDLFNTQDVSNTRMGPGFRWTLVLGRDDHEAFDWIARYTSPASVFQVDPLSRDSDTWAYLPAFAERRMGVGLPISMVPLAKYEQGARKLREVLGAGDPGAIHGWLRGRAVEFFLSGPPERAATPGLQPMLESRGDLFPLLFRNASISIYAVARNAPTAAGQ